MNAAMQKSPVAVVKEAGPGRDLRAYLMRYFPELPSTWLRQPQFPCEEADDTDDGYPHGWKLAKPVFALNAANAVAFTSQLGLAVVLPAVSKHFGETIRLSGQQQFSASVPP